MESILISACLLGIPCRYDGKSKPKFTNDEISRLREKYSLIPVCPEIYGGLPTPRVGSERVLDRVIMADGTDVTENFKRGAEATLSLARTLGATRALLKEKSPSCGKGFIYDGSFTGKLVPGDGTTAELLLKNGISVFGESEIDKLI